MTNQLRTVRTNEFWAKDNEDKMRRFIEVVLLLDNAQHRYTVEGEIIRDRIITESRFSLPADQISALTALLLESAKEENVNPQKEIF